MEPKVCMRVCACVCVGGDMALHGATWRYLALLYNHEAKMDFLFTGQRLPENGRRTTKPKNRQHQPTFELTRFLRIHSLFLCRRHTIWIGFFVYPGIKRNFGSKRIARRTVPFERSAPNGPALSATFYSVSSKQQHLAKGITIFCRGIAFCRKL
jgi:hypothetical protein